MILITERTHARYFSGIVIEAGPRRLLPGRYEGFRELSGFVAFGARVGRPEVRFTLVVKGDETDVTADVKAGRLVVS